MIQHKITDVFLENYNTLTMEQNLLWKKVNSLAMMDNKDKGVVINKKPFKPAVWKKIALFDKLTGNLNVPADFSCRK